MPRYDPSKPIRAQQAPLKPEYRARHEASMRDQDAGGFLKHNVWNIVGVFLALALLLVALIKWQDRRRVEA